MSRFSKPTCIESITLEHFGDCIFKKFSNAFLPSSSCITRNIWLFELAIADFERNVEKHGGRSKRSCEIEIDEKQLCPKVKLKIMDTFMENYYSIIVLKKLNQYLHQTYHYNPLRRDARDFSRRQF